MAEKEWSLLFLSGNYYTFIRLKRHVHTFVVQYFMNRQYQWYTKEMKHSRLSFVKFFLFSTVAVRLYKLEILLSLVTTEIHTKYSESITLPYMKKDINMSITLRIRLHFCSSVKFNCVD